MVPAVVTVGAGLVLLVVVLLLTMGHVRRFARARSALRAGIAERSAPLHELVNRRRRSSE